MAHKQTLYCRRYKKAGGGGSESQDRGSHLHINSRHFFFRPRLPSTALKRWRRHQKRSRNSFWRAPDKVSFRPPPPPTLSPEPGELLGAGSSRRASTFTDPESAALRSLLGLLFLTQALPKWYRRGACLLFVWSVTPLEC